MIQKKARAKRRTQLVVYFAALTTICAVLLAVKVAPYYRDIFAFRREQAALQSMSPFDAEWFEINSDYVGWLKIEDTNVNFPVVRGSDNVKYLNKNFYGEESILGALFMDYRCKVEDAPHIIIYGHQANDLKNEALMFGGLIDYLDDWYMWRHPVIMYMENGVLSEFEIFSARMSDVNDPAYQIEFESPDSFRNFLVRNGAPNNAKRIISLSTCDGMNNDRRMIVQGVLRRVVPISIEYDDENGWAVIELTD